MGERNGQQLESVRKWLQTLRCSALRRLGFFYKNALYKFAVIIVHRNARVAIYL